MKYEKIRETRENERLTKYFLLFSLNKRFMGLWWIKLTLLLIDLKGKRWINGNIQFKDENFEKTWRWAKTLYEKKLMMRAWQSSGLWAGIYFQCFKLLLWYRYVYFLLNIVQFKANSTYIMKECTRDERKPCFTAYIPVHERFSSGTLTPITAYIIPNIEPETWYVFCKQGCPEYLLTYRTVSINHTTGESTWEANIEKEWQIGCVTSKMSKSSFCILKSYIRKHQIKYQFIFRSSKTLKTS